MTPFVLCHAFALLKFILEVDKNKKKLYRSTIVNGPLTGKLAKKTAFELIDDYLPIFVEV